MGWPSFCQKGSGNIFSRGLCDPARGHPNIHESFDEQNLPELVDMTDHRFCITRFNCNASNQTIIRICPDF